MTKLVTINYEFLMEDIKSECITKGDYGFDIINPVVLDTYNKVFSDDDDGVRIYDIYHQSDLLTCVGKGLTTQQIINIGKQDFSYVRECCNSFEGITLKEAKELICTKFNIDCIISSTLRCPWKYKDFYEEFIVPMILGQE